MSLMIVGEIGNFSAYGFAPATLVAPLGTTTVVGMYLLLPITVRVGNSLYIAEWCSGLLTNP